MPLRPLRLGVHPCHDILQSGPTVDCSINPGLPRRLHQNPSPVGPNDVPHQRQLGNHNFISGGLCPALDFSGDQRVRDLLEIGQLLRIGKHYASERLAVDFAVHNYSRPSPTDLGECGPVGTQDLVTDLISLDDRRTQFSEHRGECRLPRADAAKDHNPRRITRYSHGATVPLLSMATNIHNWEQRVDWTLSAILWVGFGLSLFLSGLREGATAGVTLAGILAATYVVTMQVTPRRLRHSKQLGEILAIVGVTVALVGIALTGGIDSGYVIFLIGPAFFAGAFLGIRIGLETALLAAVGLIVVVAALAQPLLTGRVLESIVLYVLIAFTMSQMRRILLEERIRSDELVAATELRIGRMETAHELLQTLSSLAGAAELNPMTVGQAALRDLAVRVPFAAGQVVVGSENTQVVAATRGEPDHDITPHEYPIHIADRELGGLRLWPTPTADLAEWRETIEFTLQPVAIAFENSRLLQQIAHRAVRGERNRIARELHDDIGPSLASLGLSIDMAIHQFEVGPDLGRHLDATRRHITALTETVRGAAANLRRDETDSVIEKAHELAADISADGPSVAIAIDERRPPRGDKAVEINAILAEAFRNALAHSGATTISVRGLVDRDGGRVTVTDNGSGFDPTTRPPGHFGLVGMKERAAKIEADLDVSSAVGSGTTVSITWGDHS